jgi:hypothetical protein
LAVQIHNTTLDSSDCSFIPKLIASSLLIESNTDWRYRRGFLTVPATWNRRDFNDASWELGPTGIGYGDGDDLTVLVDMEGSYLTVFCRKEFTVVNPAAVGELLLTMVYDDGVVVFVNGIEVDRVNMPGGTVTRDTPATSSTEPNTTTVSIPGDLLVAGRNVLAVSVHNASVTSSDLSFDAVLSLGIEAGGCTASFRRGDVNAADGIVDIADAIYLLQHLFANGPAVPCMDAADANDDEAVDIADAVYMLQSLFANGPAILPPHVACGVDTTPNPHPGRPDLPPCVYDQALCQD